MALLIRSFSLHLNRNLPLFLKNSANNVLRRVCFANLHNSRFDADKASVSKLKCVNVDDVGEIKIITESNVYQFLNKYDTFLLDCDGVLWATDHFRTLSHIAPTIDKLRSLKKRILFVTNNSLHCRGDYVKKFREFVGFEAVKSEVFSVAYAAALYLKHIAKMNGRCYLIGSPGMKKELDELGILNDGYGEDGDPVSADPEILAKMQPLLPDVEAVLVGFDIHFNYNKLYKAASYLVNKRCHFICTSQVERSVDIGPRQCQPAVAPIVGAVATAAKREPIVIGKPGHHLLECITNVYPNLDLTRTVMIGDSFRSDVPFAKNVGIDSCMVLTGVSSMDDVRDREKLSKTENQPLPNYILPSLSNLNDFL